MNGCVNQNYSAYNNGNIIFDNEFIKKTFGGLYVILKSQEPYKALTPEEAEQLLKEQNEEYNSRQGTLTGYNCTVCNNKGDIFMLKDGIRTVRSCDCIKVRTSIKMIEQSGLKYVLDKYTLESYDACGEWQMRIKKGAYDFLSEDEDAWFYAGGQSGAGKTHICTAIAGELLKRCIPVKYMLWLGESGYLKANVNKSEVYQPAIDLLKTVKVLYIDDLFKNKENEPPTSADIRLAFEILNYRSVNNLTTIISSEYVQSKLVEIDEALGGRIREKTKNGKYDFSIRMDSEKNYRLR